jgi:hypothetical protein
MNIHTKTSLRRLRNHLEAVLIVFALTCLAVPPRSSATFALK